MNKKRWIYLIFLVLVFVIFFLKPTYKLFYLNSLSDSLSFFNDQQLFKVVKDFFEINKLGTILAYLGVKNSFSSLIRIGYICFSFVFSLLSLKIYTTFFEQEERCLHYEKINIVKSGILFFAALLLLIFVFLFSVVGYGLGIFFVFLANLLMIIGKIGLCLYVGGKITKKYNNYTNLIVGFILFDILFLIPYVGLIIRNVITPIISLGLLAQNIYNLFFLRRYYEDNREIGNINKKNMFNKSEIYDIIISDRKERNGNE